MSATVHDITAAKRARARSRRQFRVLVACSRTWPHDQVIVRELDLIRAVVAAGGERALCLVIGTRPTGGDPVVEDWARRNKVKVSRHPADYDLLPTSEAETRRDAAMLATEPDLALIFIHGQDHDIARTAAACETAGLRPIWRCA